LKQKYPRVPVDLDKVRREGAWVTGKDIAVTEKRWSKLPKKVRENLMEVQRIGSEETAESIRDEEKEDDNGFDEEHDGDSLEQYAGRDVDEDSMEDDENQERISKRRRMQYSPMLESTDSEASSAEDDGDDPNRVLPPNIARDTVVWLNSILLDMALAMPEVTGKELVKLNPASWTNLVDTVAVKGPGDLQWVFIRNAAR
jgi:hypothetical protein